MLCGGIRAFIISLLFPAVFQDILVVVGNRDV